jgi:DNA-binding MarR family transcriptional regulator
LQSELHQPTRPLSSPTRAQLRTWRAFFETAFSLIQIFDADLQEQSGLSLRWYDVLVHLEEAADRRMRMNELAAAIVSSKSGLTRVVDRMEEEGLVRRERPDGDRRVIEVVLTDEGNAKLQDARKLHRHGIQEYFARHLDAKDFAALERALPKVRDVVRPLRAEKLV